MFLHKTEEVKAEYAKLERNYKQEDRYTGWLYQPHTVSALIFAAILMVYVAFRRNDSSFDNNVKAGLIAAVVFWLFFAAVQFKDGLFVRPHPVIWRLIMGASVLYVCALSFILFQRVEDVRLMLKSIDPVLGVPLPERSYAENCELYTPNDTVSSFRNLRDAIKDEFFAAHFFGWFGKALLLRDSALCWIMSISFEILEVSLEHLLPNFAECWWDHLILDILVCNFLGFSLGMKVVKYFSMKNYAWVGKTGVSVVESYNWEILTSFKRFVESIVLIVVVSIVELNAFFLKFVLWIPPPHPINVTRLLLWWGIGVPGVREYYQWVSDKSCKRLGPMAWLCIATVILETLVWIKFGKGMFPKSAPTEVVVGWGAFTVVFVLWTIWYFGIRKPNRIRSNSGSADSGANTVSKQKTKKQH